MLKLSRQPYYRWLANPLTDAHRDEPEFGHRLLADEAWRIASSNGWFSVFGSPCAARAVGTDRVDGRTRLGTARI
ncbi:hypothetical protein BHE97_00970 [Aeromicrobium sp. PE09-221]|nr:hypothetical protein BHE97_00970 [Aeromicrobium sp. PE09-221]